MKIIRRNLFTLIILFFTTLLAYGQTLQMYFFIDDNALIYKLQHLHQTIGFFGEGIFGVGPYRHMVDQFIPFYPIFRVDPMPYFAVGVLLYFLAAVTIYFFVNSLTKNKIISFTSAAIFAAGYVGSESMFGIINSWQSARGFIMAILTLWLFYKYIKSRNILFYLSAVILFFFSLDTVYIRAHGLVFLIFIFDLLFWPAAFKFRRLLFLFLRQTPFILIHYYIYLSSTAYAKGFGILHLLNDIFVDRKYLLATIPIQDIGNLFIPGFFTSYVDKFFKQSIGSQSGFSIGSLSAGLFILGIFTYLIYKNYRKDKFLTKVLIFSFSFAIFNFIVFWLRETTHTLWTTHRYFFYSFAGVSLFWATSFYLTTRYMIARKSNKRKVFKFLSVGLIITLLSLGIYYQREFNQRRSFPAKKFFESFQRAVPKIPKDAVIYFNIAGDNKIRVEFSSFFGGMFSEGSNLAIYSPNIDYMKDFKFTYKFDDVTKKLQDRSTSLDKVFTFYYGENGLVDTSERTRKILSNDTSINLSTEHFSSNTPSVVLGGTFITRTAVVNSGGVMVGKNPLIIFSFPDKTLSLVPSTLNFSVSVTPRIIPLPYESGGNNLEISSEEKNKIFSYLLSQDNFRKTTVATSASFWKDQSPKLAIDSRLETAWRGHRGFWNDISNRVTKNVEYLEVDLRKTLTVSQLRWVSAQKPLAPIHYRILTSLDGRSWDLAKEVIEDKTVPEGTVVINSFPPTVTRFVKMEILKTYGNDGPELKEIEVIESQFADLDKEKIESVQKEPFGRIETPANYRDALSFVGQNSVMRLYFMSDADSKQDPTRYIEIPLIIDGKYREYSVKLPANGLNWTSITLEGFNFPADIMIKSPKITYESLQDK